MQEMYDDGYSCTAISEAFGVSRQRVGQLVRLDNDNRHYPWRKHHERKEQRPGAIWRLLTRITIEESGCWSFDGYISKEGYPRFSARRFFRKEHGDWAHRLSYLIFNGSIPKGAQIRHTCGNKSCVNPSHMIMHRKGESDDKRYSGKPGQPPKLSSEKKDEIRRRYVPRKITMRQLADEYDVSISTIFYAIHDRVYR